MAMFDDLVMTPMTCAARVPMHAGGRI